MSVSAMVDSYSPVPKKSRALSSSSPSIASPHGGGLRNFMSAPSTSTPRSASSATTSIKQSLSTSPSSHLSSLTKAPVPVASPFHVSPPAGLSTTTSATPISSLRSPPLDLRTVERRGQATAVHEPPPKKSRPHGIQEAPTYYPSRDDWKDPLTYMRKIAPEASQYGICKIVPPEDWTPDFAIDTERFHFRTRKQELNSIEGRTRANLTYLDALSKFHRQQGNNIHRLPYVDKKPLDLYKLKKAVESRGGFEKVCKLKKWAEIGRDLGYSGKIMSSLSTSLKNSYQKWLCPYEDYLRLAKPGVQQQIHHENGTSPHDSDFRHTKVESIETEQFDTSFDRSHLRPTSAISSRDTSPVSRFTPDTLTSSHKRHLSHDGGALTSALRSADKDSDDSSANHTRRSKRLKKDVSSTHDTPFHQTSTPLKQQISPLSAKGRATSTTSSVKEGESPEPEDTCVVCSRGKSMGDLIICDSCDFSYHIGCVDPPLKEVPTLEWNCPRCLVGDGQFGFEDGGIYSLRQFQKKADEFKRTFFEKKYQSSSSLSDSKHAIPEDEVEQEFWRLVSDIEETVEVEYGADIHSTTHGSGFPTVEKDPLNPYSVSPWNLNVLPLHGNSLFRHIKSDISGMTVPWVYVGMIFSTFCWHTEDHYAYSANYQHFGATKTWYGIPASDAEKFENAMREAVPELFETQPDLLFQLVTLLTPSQLKESNVKVYAVDQRAGQFVITFPKAYHAGFNHGFNFNEAVNFAPTDWEPFGYEGVVRLQAFRKQPCFSHDELLWTAASGSRSGTLTIASAKWLHPAMERIHRREASDRNTFLAKHGEALGKHDCTLMEEGEIVAEEKEEKVSDENGQRQGSNTSCLLEVRVEDDELSEDEYSCSYCKAFAYLSRFQCLTTGKVLCISHAGNFPCCDASQEERYAGKDHVLIIRKSREDMRAAESLVQNKAALPDAWEQKYARILEEPGLPSLKSLRTLLTEGDKIAYPLSSLPLLRQFVERCNEWIEKAMVYIVRKQQGRRRTERYSLSGPNGTGGGGGSTNGHSTRDVDEAESKHGNARDVGHIFRLLDEAQRIGFDAPEVTQLRERADLIVDFQERARRSLDGSQPRTVPELEELLEEARGFPVLMPETKQLVQLIDQMNWERRAKLARQTPLTLETTMEMVSEGKRLIVSSSNEDFRFFSEQLISAQLWGKKATEVLESLPINFAQLEDLRNRVIDFQLPVDHGLLQRVTDILVQERDVQKRVLHLVHQVRKRSSAERPPYRDVVEVVKLAEDITAKPSGGVELEREQKRHEDWMRKGKKLIGKTNAPLHILKAHLEHVFERNRACFDLTRDRPTEPASTAAGNGERVGKADGSEGEVADADAETELFCLCRRGESGTMIECHACHEWYHCRCLKISRSKIKDESGEMWMCPVCDYRVKIPRDAARPKLEDLIAWQDEIATLPFDPEEEEIIGKVVEQAQTFRDIINVYVDADRDCDGDDGGKKTLLSLDDLRFYLRKLEGAEVLLAHETNYFRLAIHRHLRLTDDPPPLLEESKSTRKPRPTKLQRLLSAYKVDDADSLPEEVREELANPSRRRSIKFVNYMDTIADTSHSNSISPSSAALAAALEIGTNPSTGDKPFPRSSTTTTRTSSSSPSVGGGGMSSASPDLGRTSTDFKTTSPSDDTRDGQANSSSSVLTTARPSPLALSEATPVPLPLHRSPSIISLEK